ncbi:MAG: TonB-dependent receptor [Bacteroidota bacterium]
MLPHRVLSHRAGALIPHAFFALYLWAAAAPTQGATLEGYVRDSGSRMPIPGAGVSVSRLVLPDSAASRELLTLTNDEGRYSFSHLLPGRYQLRVRSIGYRTAVDTVAVDVGTVRHDVLLEATPIQIQPLDVTGERMLRESRGSPSYVALPARELKRLPGVGEQDLIRSLQLLPGVQAASDFSSGLYIRGGGPDQTLILLDQTPLYNPTHAFGFFSTFNPGAIQDVALYKGAYPSQYGGRLGSVLDVENRDGSRDAIHGEGGVSVIAGRLTAEGPIRDGSWIVSARRTYLEPILNAVRNDTTEIPSYFFYDLNARVHRTFGSRNDLTLSGYRGRDNLHLDLDQGTFVDIRWGNVAGTARWTHALGDGAFANVYATATEYRSDTNVKVFSTPLAFANRLLDVGARGDVTFRPAPAHTVSSGAAFSTYRFQLIQAFNGQAEPGFDERPSGAVAYIEDQWSPSVLWIIRPGLRTEWFGHSGLGVEPRFSASRVLTPTVRVKLGGGGYTQHLQLVSTEAFSGTDFWVPTDASAKPGRSWQGVAGAEWEPSESYLLSIESYYTFLRNLVQLDSRRPGDSQGTTTEDLFYTGGRGWASGLELFAHRRRGALTGWIGYTLGWSRRQWAELNGGAEFPPKYDRRNDLKVVAQWNRSRWSFGADFVYSTGQAYTPVVAKYGLADPATGDVNVILLPGARNSARLLPYHRLDLSATLHGHLFGARVDYYAQIFNVYDRKNEWFIQYDVNNTVTEPKIVHQLPLIPTIGINFDL